MFKEINLKTLYTIITISLIIENPVISQDFAQEAHDILNDNCMGCHHTIDDLMTVDRYKSNLINMLTTPDPLVDPYDRMPPNREKLDDELIQTINDWIYSEYSYQKPIIENKIESDRKIIGPQDKLKVIEAHLKNLSEPETAIYFTITSLHNSEYYLGALSKLVNSLSWKSEMVLPKIVEGSNETVFYVDRLKLGWYFQKWNVIIEKYPYDTNYGEPELYSRIQHLTETQDQKIPVLFADWFIAHASSGEELYHTILYDDQKDDWRSNSITDEQTLVEDIARRRKGISGYGGSPFDAPADDIHRSADSRFAGSEERMYQAAGFEISEVAEHNRIVDRIPFDHKKYFGKIGVYWKSYDFESEDDLGDIFRAKQNFRHAGNEMIFELPNGLHAFFITDNIGQRLESAPETIVRDHANRGRRIINGISCMGCHASGIIKNFQNDNRLDWLKPLAIKDGKTIQEWIDIDNKNFKEALNSINIEIGNNSIVDIYNNYFNTGSRRSKELYLSINYSRGKISKEIIAAVFGLTDSEYWSKIIQTGLLSEHDITWANFEDKFYNITKELYSNDDYAAPAIAKIQNPRRMVLLPNYPNPSNPETWIPYQLATETEVTLHIYNINGRLVRTLNLGLQPAGRYITTSRAAYWDGRNEIGEQVASGVYFYTLQTQDFTATRKMVIKK